MDSNDNLMLLSCCAQGVSIENEMKRESEVITISETLPSVSSEDIQAYLQEQNITLTTNDSMPNANDLFLDWENDIPNTNVVGVPKSELIFTDEEIEFHSSIANAIDRALT